MRSQMTMRIHLWLNTAPILIFVLIVASVRDLPQWVVIGGVTAAIIRLLLGMYTQQALAERLLGMTRFVEALSTRSEVPALPPSANDELGTLQRSLTDLGQAVRDQREALTVESAQREFESRLHRALEVADSEDETLLVLQNGMSRIAPDGPIQLLLAQDGESLAPVLSIGSDHGVGCRADHASRCPAMRRGQVLVFDSDALDACPQLQEDAPGSCSACVPINVMGHAVGVLQLRGEGNGLEHDKVVRLETLARQAGSRLSVLRTLETTQLQASTDALTGLLNRRAGSQRIADLMRHGTHFSLVMADIDHFKRLNDNHGHATGDRALIRFADVLRKRLRANDILVRHGGEEFVFALVDANEPDATALLERVRAALARSWDGPAFTASFGVVSSERADHLDDLLRKADRALYDAKNAGRDRVIVASRGSIAPVIALR